MDPASTIIGRLGGPAVVAAITQTSYTAPYRWQQPRTKRGTDGFIPRKYHQKLLDYARKRAIPLEASDFVSVDGVERATGTLRGAPAGSP